MCSIERKTKIINWMELFTIKAWSILSLNCIKSLSLCLIIGVTKHEKDYVLTAFHISNN